jgi:[calcium/calmodulin-dependent protein kinase] kinase
MFMAPECVSPEALQYSGKQADIWAMGVTLFCFLRGSVPWSTGSMVELHEEIRTANPPYQIGDEEELSTEASAILKQLFDKDPATRIEMSRLRSHAWVTRCGTDALESAPEVEVDGTTLLPVPIVPAKQTSSLLRTRAHSAPTTSSPLARSRTTPAAAHEIKSTSIRLETTLTSVGAKTSSVVETKFGPTTSTTSIRGRRKRGRSNRA